MNERVKRGDLVWVPSNVRAHSDFSKSLITKVPRNFLVTEVGNNYINVLIDGKEWTVNKQDVFPCKARLNERRK
tara:strand:+ start:1585 stop:1806 length:222 start_codon:yes stop_codon:yes gene_type:complete